MEDPFDATDNCARTIGFSKIDSIVTAFGRAAAVMNSVRDEAGGLAFSVAITQHMVNPLTSLMASMCPGAQVGASFEVNQKHWLTFTPARVPPDTVQGHDGSGRVAEDRKCLAAQAWAHWSWPNPRP